MKPTNPRIERLKEMLALEEQRAALEYQLEGLNSKLSELKDQLSETSSSAAGSYYRANHSKPRETRFGSLKQKVMQALEAAGKEGVRVKDLAVQLGTKPVNIHSWFHSNIKRNPAIQKLNGGHYRLDGVTASTSSTLSRSSKPASSRSGPRGARGNLRTRIMGELQTAGLGGITVRELSERLALKYKNIYVWFSTTGKKNPNIEKVGTATYRLNK